jgi:hypothetical protein
MGEKPSLMQLCLLRRGPNGLMASFLAITVVLTIWANGYNASNGHITSPW